MTPTARSTQPSVRVLPAWGRLILILAGLLAGAEIACRLTLSSLTLADRPVDIQTADTLCAKVERVRGYPGPKIVVLGDSLAYGAALGDHGDKDWRQHELASEIRATLAASSMPGTMPALVMNLGLNGGLPADQLRILRMFDGVKLDALIVTTAIRSFATDFAPANAAYSRAWLAGLTAADLPACRIRQADIHGDAWIGRQVAKVSALYRSRGLIQANLLGGSFREANEARRASLKSKPAKGGAPDLMASLGLDGGGDLQTLMLAKTRFQKIAFTEPHAQVAATRELIAQAGLRVQRAVFVYGTENPKLMPQLLSASRYAKARADLKALFDARPANVTFLDGIKPAARDYLDYVHVNRDGYRLMAAEIVKAISP